jgi:homoserine dehydrogenase
MEVARILVREPERERAFVDPALLTRTATDVIDADCDVVVELIGGVYSAGAFVRRAIALRRDVVTANKALLAAHGRDIFASAAAQRVLVGFEASVCGGVPVIRALRDGLAGDTIESISGIVNGTCNFVLSRMEDGASFDDALASARDRGLAEWDCTLDISGEDAAQKLQILAELAFDRAARRTTFTGIASITPADVEAARSRGKVIRLVGEAVRAPGGVEIHVEPRELAADDPLARVRDETNALLIRGNAIGELLLVGKGAGSMPTATAVLSDVLEIARMRRFAKAA